jgi:hypothetical protein
MLIESILALPYIETEILKTFFLFGYIPIFETNSQCSFHEIITKEYFNVHR